MEDVLLIADLGSSKDRENARSYSSAFFFFFFLSLSAQGFGECQCFMPHIQEAKQTFSKIVWVLHAFCKNKNILNQLKKGLMSQRVKKLARTVWFPSKETYYTFCGKKYKQNVHLHHLFMNYYLVQISVNREIGECFATTTFGSFEEKQFSSNDLRFLQVMSKFGTAKQMMVNQLVDDLFLRPYLYPFENVIKKYHRQNIKYSM